MKRFLLTLLLAPVFSAFGQDVTSSRTSSYHTFVYQITNEEARALYRHNNSSVGTDYFHTLIDTYPTDSVYRKKLPTGHYLFVKSIANQAETILESVNNLDMKILNNSRDMLLVFHDQDGMEILNLKPEIKNRNIPYSKKLNAYRLSKTNKQGHVIVEHEGQLNFFNIKRQFNNTLATRTKRRVLYTFPINHIVSPFTYTFRSIRGLIKYGSISPPGIYYRASKLFKASNHEGYLVLNKPKFKPGDTVKIKAFITTRRGNPIAKTLEVFISGYSPYINKKIGVVSPYRDGAYVFEFILNDTLKLSLDKNYTVQLKDKRNNQYPNQTFAIEHYELNQNFFSLKPAPENKLNGPASVLLKGTDSNDMPLYDIQADVLVKPKKIIDFFEKKVFVPDTLWTQSVKLEPLGDTRVTLPAIIFPNVSLDYEVSTTFVNAENERQAQSISLSHNTVKQPSIEVEHDSVVFSFSEQGDYQVATRNTTGEIVQTKNVILPYTEKIQSLASIYELLADGKPIKHLAMGNISDQVEVVAARTKDSLTLALQNPRKLPIRFQLFKNNVIVGQGYSQEYNHRQNANPNDRYYFSLQYIWAGTAQEQNYDLPFAKKPLSISIDHPITVFPGQSTDIAVTVKDAFGKAVNDVDLTAYAITKKFGNGREVSVPNFENFKNRKAFNSFSQLKITDKKLFQKFEYDFWKMRLGLDSIQYYQFLFPSTGMFRQYTAAEDSITQIAPYIVKDGFVQPVYYIYFDKELKYYYGVESIEPYSFAVNERVKDITIRLKNHLVKIKNVTFTKGRKLVLSVDLNNPLANVEISETQDHLSEDEMKILRPHFLWMSRNENQKQAFFQQDKSFHVLQPYQNRYGFNAELVGPFFPGTVTYNSGFDISFPFKPMMNYHFRPNLVDRESITPGLPKKLPYLNFQASLKDQVLTQSRIQEYWKGLEEKISYRFKKYPDNQLATKEFGSLSLKERNPSKKPVAHFATFILNLDRPDEFYIYPPGTHDFSWLTPALYQCLIIYADESYINPKPIQIRAYGTTFYDVSDEPSSPPDSFSTAVLRKIKEWSEKNHYVDQVRMQDMQGIRQLYYREATDYTTYSGGRWVSGTITDPQDGMGIPGANVLVKGTTIGTVSDANGFYRVYVPYNGVLIFSFIGYMTQEIETGSRTTADAELTADVQQLSEVVVVAYGVQYSKSLTSSVSTVSGLFGKIPGVQISGDSASIKLRGFAAVNSNQTPIVIIDGVLKRMEDINTSQVVAIEILESEQAMALYGSRAANGVILISTKPGTTRAQLLQAKLPEVPQFISLEGNIPGSSLRKNFRDYAFWQPALRTDANGVATFKATYPDDITSWNIHVLGMASQKRSGEASQQVQSFKPLVAQLALPNFLVAGDSAWGVGKITNYTADSIRLKKIVAINDSEMKHGEVNIKNSWIDSVSLVGVGDSLSVKYEIEYKNYRDGELRKIPVMPIGALDANGFFVALPNDTTFTLTFDKKSHVKIFAQADLIDLLLDEVQVMKAYPYECNEQLASKLKALLAEETILEYKKEKFEHSRWIEKIIKKLSSKQAKDGSWSWWGMHGGSTWITLHIAEAFRWAEKLGYSISYDRKSLTDFLTDPSVFASADDQLRAWIYLSSQGEKLIARSLTDTLSKQNKLYDHHYKLLAARLLQLNGEEPDWKWIDSVKRKTLKGNIYWGEEKATLWNNDTDNTLLVYQLIEHKNPTHADLLLIRNYFIEKRKRSWANTYQSSRIIETLLPSLKKERGTEKTSLSLSGDIVHTISRFPFEKTYQDIQRISVTKKGDAPVYFTAYEEQWDTAPKKVEGDFIIKTNWSDQSGKLKAGKPVTLQVSVEVKKDAEFVMINVPIPAGCSYAQKIQSRTHGEVHREYDIHETRIYCERLRAGNYQYTIQLTPRYKGKYHLNPAKVEWMYFPVIYGREEMKKVTIK